MTETTTRVPRTTAKLDVAAIHAKAIELGKHVLRMTTAAGSGHPSTSLALAHIIVELMYRRMKYDPADPWNPGNDRLVLSIGHGVPIVYAAYADLRGAIGVRRANPRLLSVNDLASLRELDSVLDGHPNPAEGFPFFDAATGSLGQGLSVAAGLALAARLDQNPRRIYAIVGDGESREGQVWEAADFIAEQELKNVCMIVSCNGHGQASAVSQQQSAEVLARKFEAFGWSVRPIDGHDPEEIAAALDTVDSATKPVAILARTVKGWGVELMRRENYHGKTVAASLLETACGELDATGAKLGARGGSWSGVPRPRVVAGSPRTEPGRIALPPFADACRKFGHAAALDKKAMATRVAYGVALAALGDVDERIVCLDADVSNSTFANIFAKAHPDRFIECKIAEQNMVTAAAGMSAAGKIAFASSFAKFLARATDQVDMAAISRANIKLVGSHSGVSLGADGPSQMSLADVAYFRSMTRARSGDGEVACRVFQPADAIAAYRCTELLANTKGVGYMRTHRPDAPFVYSEDERFELGGCKQVRRGESLTLVSSGYMLFTVLEAAEQLAKGGLRCNVFDVYTLPVDAAVILEAARGAGGAILTVEDNYLGGVHGEIAEAAAGVEGIRVHGMTVGRIPKSAKSAAEEFEYVGVGLRQIVEQATTLVRT